MLCGNVWQLVQLAMVRMHCSQRGAALLLLRVRLTQAEEGVRMLYPCACGSRCGMQVSVHADYVPQEECSGAGSAVGCQHVSALQLV